MKVFIFGQLADVFRFCTSTCMLSAICIHRTMSTLFEKEKTNERGLHSILFPYAFATTTKRETMKKREKDINEEQMEQVLLLGI